MSDHAQKPPSADSKKAEKYINQFVSLIDSDRLKVARTDLSKFDPSALQDHYRLDFDEYSVEVSHSKQPNTGSDSFIMLFTNIKQIEQSGNCEKVILAYLHLDQNQFIRFKSAAQDQLDRERKAEEERRFTDAINPIDQALEKLNGRPQNDNFQQLPDSQTSQLENQLEQNGMYLTDFSSDRVVTSPDDNSIKSHEFPDKLPSQPLNY